MPIFLDIDENELREWHQLFQAERVSKDMEKVGDEPRRVSGSLETADGETVGTFTADEEGILLDVAEAWREMLQDGLDTEWAVRSHGEEISQVIRRGRPESIDSLDFFLEMIQSFGLVVADVSEDVQKDNPDQARDEGGQFTSTGGGGTGAGQAERGKPPKQFSPLQAKAYLNRTVKGKQGEQFRAIIADSQKESPEIWDKILNDSLTAGIKKIEMVDLPEDTSAQWLPDGTIQVSEADAVLDELPETIGHEMFHEVQAGRGWMGREGSHEWNMKNPEAAKVHSMWLKVVDKARAQIEGYGSREAMRYLKKFDKERAKPGFGLTYKPWMDTDGMMMYLTRTKEIGVRAYSLHSPHEFSATMFQEYLKFPGELKKANREVYDFFDGFYKEGIFKDNPDQARDEGGRFSSTGGTGDLPASEGASAAERKTPRLKEGRRLGAEEPNGTAPDVDWSSQDLQDNARTITAESIRQTYANSGDRMEPVVYQSYVALNALEETLSEEEEEAEELSPLWIEDAGSRPSRSVWTPIKIAVHGDAGNVRVEILDGNHRVKFWRDHLDFDEAPAWVLDYRSVAGAKRREKPVRKDLEDVEAFQLSIFDLLVKDNPDQARDEGGRFTSTGGGGFVSVAASEVRPGTAMVYGGGLRPDQRQAGGAPLRGDEAISWDDKRIPDTVYHMTTNLPAVEREGHLRAGGQGGLGGDPQDQVVSMTIDRGFAEQMTSDMKFSVQYAQKFSEGSPKWDFDEKQSKWVPTNMSVGEAAARIEAAITMVRARAETEKWEYHPEIGLGATIAANIERGLFTTEKDILSRYYQYRQNRTELVDPLIYTSLKDLAKLDPEKIGVVAVPKANLNNGALIVDFDLRNRFGLKEIRSYGDVPLRGAEFRKAASWDEVEKDNPDQARDAGGQFTSTGGGGGNGGTADAEKPTLRERVNGTPTKGFTTKVRNGVALVDDHLIRGIRNAGVTLQFRGYGIPGHPNATGLWRGSTSQISVAEITGKGQVNSDGGTVAIHEIGHAIQSVYGDRLQDEIREISDAFEKAYAKLPDWEKHGMTHYNLNERERWARTFEHFFAKRTVSLAKSTFARKFAEPVRIMTAALEKLKEIK
jgi:hypothetical protein